MDIRVLAQQRGYPAAIDAVVAVVRKWKWPSASLGDARGNAQRAQVLMGAKAVVPAALEFADQAQKVMIEVGRGLSVAAGWLGIEGVIARGAGTIAVRAETLQAVTDTANNITGIAPIVLALLPLLAACREAFVFYETYKSSVYAKLVGLLGGVGDVLAALWELVQAVLSAVAGAIKVAAWLLPVGLAVAGLFVFKNLFATGRVRG